MWHCLDLSVRQLMMVAPMHTGSHHCPSCTQPHSTLVGNARNFMWVYLNRYEFGLIEEHRRITGNCCLSFRHHNKRCLGSRIQIYDSDHNQQYSTYLGTIFACRCIRFIASPFYLLLSVLCFVNHSLSQPASQPRLTNIPTYLPTYLHVIHADTHRYIAFSPLL